MFLDRRSEQAEYFDLPGRTASEIEAEFRDLDRINRFFQFARPFQDKLPAWLGTDQCRQLQILDVGAGTGFLGRTLSAWAAKRGWDWRFTNLDANADTPQCDAAAVRVVGSALQMPFADASFDLVIASQMTHHFNDEQVVVHLREAWRVTRDAVMISDLHRNVGLRVLLWVGAMILRVGPEVRSDGMISVARGFRPDEFRQLARQSGLENVRVNLHFGARILLFARKGKDSSQIVPNHRM
jgi:ubiquinone/menaquinone biosynthesis C-methylase UbiE